MNSKMLLLPEKKSRAAFRSNFANQRLKHPIITKTAIQLKIPLFVPELFNSTGSALLFHTRTKLPGQTHSLFHGSNVSPWVLNIKRNMHLSGYLKSISRSHEGVLAVPLATSNRWRRLRPTKKYSRSSG